MAKEAKKRKYRVRYDRIVIVMLVLVTIAVIATSCTKALFGSNEPDSPMNNSSITASIPEETNTISESPTDSTETEPSEIVTGEVHDTTSAPEVPTELPTESLTENVPDGYKKEIHPYDDIYKGDLVLVNADYEYKFLEDDIDVVTLVGNRNDYYSAGDYVTSLDKIVLYQLNSMIKAFAEYNNLETTDIFVQDGYRTYEEQVDRHSTGKSRTFEAGHTDYHTGRTFDMFYNDSESGTGFAYFSAEGNYYWFAENAGNYGFIVRYPEDKQEITGENPRAYTYRYVGIPHAYYINSNNLCLEEYIEELKAYTIDNPLGIATEGRNYSVYYVPAENSDMNEILVPSDKVYKVSGNNADGFIVTVID